MDVCVRTTEHLAVNQLRVVRELWQYWLVRQMQCSCGTALAHLHTITLDCSRLFTQGVDESLPMQTTQPVNSKGHTNVVRVSTHTNLHTHSHVCTHTHMYTHSHMHTHSTCTHTLTCMRALTCTHTMHTHAHALTHAHTHIHSHTIYRHTHVCTHMYANTHAHTYKV